MTAPDYPLLALGGYETYQLAHIATYVAERLARHRRSGRGREGRATRIEAVRDLAGAATALSNATGATVRDDDLPRPLDRGTFATARELLTTGPRTADVVALAGIGQEGFAVVGHVPGIGAVGARVPTQRVAEAVQAHFLIQPAAELAVWAVTREPQKVPTLPRQIDLAGFVEHLDPGSDGDRAVAGNLRGQNRRTDAAIRGRFAGTNLDAPFVVAPTTADKPENRRSTRPAQRAQSGGPVRRMGLRQPAPRAATGSRNGQSAAAAIVPNTSAGP